jgi:hypothetical protein
VNAAERKDLQRATVLLVAGDRSAALAVLRALKELPLRAVAEPSTQLLFAFTTFRCERLSVENVAAHTCFTRQRVTDLQRTQQASRGQGTDYPLCDTRTCAQGRSVRERLDPNLPMAWQGAGPGGRFERERSRATNDEEA